MWVSMNEMIGLARPGSAIGSFLAVNLEQAQGIMEAAVELRLPVIVALSEPGSIYTGLSPFLAMCRELAGQVPVPVSLQLGHVHGLDFISHALEKGCTGVLVDGGKEDEKQRLHRLGAIKELCNQNGALFEVEIGAASGDMKTDFAGRVLAELQPDSACITVPDTEREKPSPDLFNVTESIITSTRVPISIAGAGSWRKEDIKSFIDLGVWKISIGTRTNQAFTRGLKQYLQTHPDRVQPRSYLGHARETFRQEVRECMASLLPLESEEE